MFCVLQMVRKLANIAFTGDHEYKLIAAILQPHDEPAALRAALPILTSNTTINTSPALEGFTMSAELAAVIVAAAGPGGVWSKPALLELTWPADAAVVTPLPQLGYVDLAGPLDSDTLAQMLACVREAGPLCVPDLDLDVPRPEGSMWPFHSVKLYNEVRLDEWLGQVKLLGQVVWWELGRVKLIMGAHMVSMWHTRTHTHRHACMHTHRLVVKRRHDGIHTTHAPSQGWPLYSILSVLCVKRLLGAVGMCVCVCVQVDSGEARRLAEQVSNVRISHMESFHIECDGGMLTDVMGHRWVRDGLSVFRHLPVRPQRVYMNGTKVEDLFPGHAGCARVVC